MHYTCELSDKLKNCTGYSDSYRFFDEVFTIKSDSREILDKFKKVYKYFNVNSDNAKSVYYVLTQKEAMGFPGVVLDEKVYPIYNPDILCRFACMSILNSVSKKIKTHFLIHGASLSINGKGVCLPGESGFGKTTLTLKLIEKGFKCLSDEFTALNKLSFKTDPFPRHLQIRENTLKIAGSKIHSDCSKIIKNINDNREWIVDINDLRNNALGIPCVGEYIFILTSENKRTTGNKSLYLFVDRVTDKVMDGLKNMLGVENISIVKEKPSPIIKIYMKKEIHIVPMIESICDENDIEIFNAAWNDCLPPDFTKSPRLEEIPNSRVLMELTRRLLNGSDSSLCNEFEGSLTKMIFKLGEIIKSMKCYMLFPGKLDETTELICNTVGL